MKGPAADSRPVAPAVDQLSANGRAIFVRWLAEVALASVLKELEDEQAARELEQTPSAPAPEAAAQ